jgi:hypothetical protein
MASLSAAFPLAYHVLPLHALKGIARESALLGKAGRVFSRPTTSTIDRTLGFGDVVHLYLATSTKSIIDLPILRAQLGPSSKSPFPHLALEMVTSGLDDDEVRVCNWNLAVSRPAVPGLCRGGNWTRGTNAGHIAEVWSAFRAGQPDPKRARGFFNDDQLVPTLTGPQVRSNPALLHAQHGRTPELLLRPPVLLERFSRLIAFSSADAEFARTCGADSLPLALETFPGYSSALVPEALRSQIVSFFDSDAEELGRALPFDSVRPASLSVTPRSAPVNASPMIARQTSA